MQSSGWPVAVVSSEIDVRNCGAQGDDSTDCAASFQRAIDMIERNGAGTLIVPAGQTFRLRNPLRIRKGNITIRGGGTIHQDSSAWSSVNIPGVGSVSAAIVVWSGTSTRRYVSPWIPYDPAFDGALVPGVTIGDVNFLDDFGYTSEYVTGKSALFLAGVTGFSMRGASFTGFCSEAVTGDIAWKSSTISACSFRECAQNGISPVVSDGCVFSGNDFTRVAQPFECSMLRGEITNNRIDQCSSNGIWVGTTALSIGMTGRISGNVITKAAVSGAGILVENRTATSCIYDVSVDHNSISGSPADGGNMILAHAKAGAVVADGGTLSIANNTISEDPDAANDWSSAIQVFSADTAPIWAIVRIADNVVTHRTGHAYSSIYWRGGGQHVIDSNNTVSRPFPLRGDALP